MTKFHFSAFDLISDSNGQMVSLSGLWFPSSSDLLFLPGKKTYYLHRIKMEYMCYSLQVLGMGIFQKIMLG